MLLLWLIRIFFLLLFFVKVFEVTIRILGGLLSAHIFMDELNRPWYFGGLLTLASDLGERLLPAFVTATGIPYHRVNLRHGVLADETSQANTAGAGTLTLEFGTLSRLTGDDRFADAARGAVAALFARRSQLDLVGGLIDVHSGQWLDRIASIGAGGDSFYEYLFKSYVLFGDSRELLMFNRTYEAVERHMRSPQGWYFEVDMVSGAVARRYTDSLGAFWPGLQASIGAVDAAEQVLANYVGVWRHFGFLPEAMHALDAHGEHIEVRHGMYLLRPELIESAYFLYRTTRNTRHLDALQMVIESLEATRTRCGFACVADVTSATLRFDDRLDSFFLSETLKYLYLAFDDDNPLHRRNVVFTTEGHPLPVKPTRRRETKSRTVAERIMKVLLHATTTPRFERQRLYASELVQRNLAALESHMGNVPHSRYMCARPMLYDTDRDVRDETMATFAQVSLPRRFVWSRKRQNSNKVTISKSTLGDQTAAASVVAGAAGAVAPAPTTDAAAAPPVPVQWKILFHRWRPYDVHEHVVLLQNLDVPLKVTPLMPVFGARSGGWSQIGAPALFGPALDADGVCAPLSFAVPKDACSRLTNDVEGKIVLVSRGSCFFVDKVGYADAAGAVGVIVMDSLHKHVDSFNAMIGVESRPWQITIPSLLLGSETEANLEELLGDAETVCIYRMLPTATPVVKQPEMSPREVHEFDRVMRDEVSAAFHFVTLALHNSRNEFVPVHNMLLEMVAMQLEVQWKMDLVHIDA